MSRLISLSPACNRTIVYKCRPQIDAWPRLNAEVRGPLKEINARASIQGNTVDAQTFNKEYSTLLSAKVIGLEVTGTKSCSTTS